VLNIIMSYRRYLRTKHDQSEECPLPSSIAGQIDVDYKEESRTIDVTWNISDYLERESQVFIETNGFKTPAPYDEFVWKLKVYPIGKSFISLHLMLVSGPRKILVEYQFETVDTPFGRMYKTSQVHSKEFAAGKEHAVFCLDFEPRQLPYSGRTPGLVIKATIKICDFTSPLSEDDLAAAKEELFQGYQVLYESQKYADITFEVEGRELKAHKVILAARSPVLAAMFESNLAESQKNYVCVTDVDFRVMQAVLRFIYTGDVVNRSGLDKPTLDMDAAIKLYEAADKYDLPTLSKAMEEFVMYNLDKEFAIRALIAAHLHNSVKLKRTCIKYVSDRNEQDFEDWSDLNHFPAIIDEIDDEKLAKQLDKVQV